MTEAQFKAKILRMLGNDFYKVEITDEQLDDAIDEAVDYFLEYHFDGGDPSVYLLTLVDGQTTYTLPSTINSVVGYYRFAEYPELSIKKLLYEWNPNILTTDLVTYAMFNAYIEEVDILAGVKYDFHFNATTNVFTLMNLEEATTIPLRVFTDQSVSNMDKIYENRWFQKFTQCIAGIQMGDNIDHFDGELIGGLRVNYEKVLTKYEERRLKLEEELYNRYTSPCPIIYG